jgi:RNA polymerase sigma-70 factor (ECF subfamily)
MKAYKNLSKFKGDSKLSTWLYKITYHTCLDTFKKKEYKHKTESIDDNFSIHISDSDAILASIEKQERAKLMKICLDELLTEEKNIVKNTPLISTKM